VDDSVGGNNVGFLNSGTGTLRYYLHYTSLEHLSLDFLRASSIPDLPADTLVEQSTRYNMSQQNLNRVIIEPTVSLIFQQIPL